MTRVRFSDSLPYGVIIFGAASLISCAFMPSLGPPDWTVYAAAISFALMCVFTLLWLAFFVRAEIARRKHQRS